MISLPFLGVMGVTNGQRTLNYIRSIVEFISQPQYANVAQMFMPVNEAYVTTIGSQVMREWYLEVYDMMRNITGVGEGNGPFMTIHDGCASTCWHSTRAELCSASLVNLNGTTSCSQVLIDLLSVSFRTASYSPHG